MTPKLTQRALRLKPSATFQLARKAQELREAGHDVISFGLGEPDFDTPEPIRRAAHEAIDSGQTHYTANEGILPLRRAIRDAYERDQQVAYAAAGEVLVTAGAKQAIAHAVLALVEEGDEVLVPVPYWLTYPAIVGLAGAEFRPVETRAGDGFQLTREALEQAASPRSRLLILNSPNNPTGAVLRRESLSEIADFVCSRDLLVISDEIYGPLTYSGHPAVSIAAVRPELRERTVVCHGLSKAYAMTGWRIGYALGPAEIIGAMSRIQGHTTSNACSISQHAAVVALNQCGGAIESMRARFEQRRELVLERLGGLPGLEVSPPDGAFYLFPRIASLFGKQTRQGTVLNGSSDFCQALLEEQQVSLVPGIEFGADDCFRFSYAASEADLEQGCERIARFIGDLR